MVRRADAPGEAARTPRRGKRAVRRRQAALLRRVEAAEAEPGEDVPAEVLWAELGLSDRR